jgi:hypothetical protein
MLAKLKSKIANQILCPIENNEKNLIDNLKKSQQSLKKSGEVKKNGGLEFNFQEEYHQTSEASVVLTTNSIVSGIEKKNSKTLKTSQRTKKETTKPTLLIDNKKIFEYYKGKKVDENPSKSKTFLVRKKNESHSEIQANENLVQNQEISNIDNDLDLREESPLKLEELLKKSDIYLKNNELNGNENQAEDTNKLNNDDLPDTELKISQSPPQTRISKKEKSKNDVLNNNELFEEDLKSSKRKEHIQSIHRKNSKNVKEKRKLQENQLKIIRNKSEGSVKFEKKLGFQKLTSKGSINKKTVDSGMINKHASEELLNQMNEKPNKKEDEKLKKSGRKINLINNKKTGSTPARLINPDKDFISGKRSLEGNKTVKSTLELKEKTAKNKEMIRIIDKHTNNLIPGNNYNPDKYKAFDVQSLEYDILKELDSNIKPDLNEEFMIRMEKDVERRIKKDETIKTIVKEKQVTLQEEDRVKTFNRLIQDANRRMESAERLKELQDMEEREKKYAENSKKKYENKEWEEIYENRFMRYNDDKNRKIKEKRSEKKAKEKEMEQIIVEQINSTKRSSKKEIITSSKRMCDEEMNKRKKNLITLNKKYNKDNQVDNIQCNKASITSNPENIYHVINILNQSDSDHFSNYYSGKDSIVSPKYSSINLNSKSNNITENIGSPSTQKAEPSIDLKEVFNKKTQKLAVKSNSSSHKNLKLLNKSVNKNEKTFKNKKTKSFKSVDFKHLIISDINSPNGIININ